MFFKSYARPFLIVPDLEKISRQVNRGKKMEDAVGKFDWKDFESIVGDIFRENGFSVRNNFRFKTKRRWEMDLVAVRGEDVMCVDCKRWSNGRQKAWSLRKAAGDQSQRTGELGKFVRSNPIARGIMRIPAGRFVPLVVTLHEEELLRERGTFVVPLRKLNTFLVEFDGISDI